MKVLFLDIDGVLCFGTFKGKSITYLVPECISELNRVMKAEPDLNIIISSTWRTLYSLPWLIDHLENAGFIYHDRVLGVTDSLSKIPQKQGVPRPQSHKISSWVDRGWEIQEWLDRHPEVTNFVILDDDADMVHLKHRFVQTVFDDGLTTEKADEVLEILKNA